MLSEKQIKESIFYNKKSKSKLDIVLEDYEDFLDYLLKLNEDNFLDNIDFFMYCAKYPHHYYSANGKR
jgi:hypothetical protein